MLLSADGFLFGIECNPKSGSRQIKQFPKINEIKEICAGFSHILALRRIDRPAFVDYTPEQVGKWMAKIGFSSTQNLCRFQKISGRVWTEQKDEEKFLRDNFGVSEDEIMKI